MNTRDASRLQAPRRYEPVQNRAGATVEKILKATGDVLVSVGIERLSTNLVCSQAGVSPPALYRYFPDKYALLEELGLRLMASQNALLELDEIDFANLPESLYRVLLAQYEITIRQPAGTAIMRALRAVPRLSDVRTRREQVRRGIVP